MQDENQLLRDTMHDLETREGFSFEDGYFTTCYEVATALPPPFDLRATLNWDRDQIMAKAAQLSGGDPGQGTPPTNLVDTDPIPTQRPDLPIDVPTDMIEKVAQDPLTTQKNLIQDSTPPFEIASMEEEEALTESGIPVVGGIQTGIVAEDTKAETARHEESIKEKRDD